MTGKIIELKILLQGPANKDSVQDVMESLEIAYWKLEVAYDGNMMGILTILQMKKRSSKLKIGQMQNTKN